MNIRPSDITRVALVQGSHRGQTPRGEANAKLSLTQSLISRWSLGEDSVQADKDVERISGDQPDVSRHRPHCRGSERNSHARNTDQTLQYFSLGCGDLFVCHKHVRLDRINADIWKNSFPPDPLLTFAAGVTLISARRGEKKNHTIFT